MRIYLLVAFCILPSIAFGQQVRPANSSRIYHEIAQLQNLVNVLYVAAHPDDENTRLLAWLVNEKNIRTAYLSLTRGDGGQNILGSEQGDALGLIRTHELMEARKIDGAEQFFTRAIDFGFSKTYEETFKHWPEERLVGDVVWVYRMYRPDVVITRFPPDTNAGHGQHAASAIVAAKAFKASGRATEFAEQITSFSPWQPKRLVFNSFRFGSRNTVTEDQFKLAVGDYVPDMGMGTGEIAGISRSVHKSQGAGTPSTPGVQTEYFKLVDGEPFSQSLFDGIDITWGRVGKRDIGTDIQSILERFDFKKPEASLPALLLLRKKIETVADNYWRNKKLAEIDNIIIDCTGFMAELYAKQPQAVKGTALPFTLRVIGRARTRLGITRIEWGGSDTVMDLRLPYDSLLAIEHTIGIPTNAQVTEPYWLEQRHETNDMFSIPDKRFLGLPETPNELYATIHLALEGNIYKVKVPLSYKKLDPVKGDIVEQLRIVPGATVEFNSALLVTHNDGSVQCEVRVHAYKDIVNGKLTVWGKSDIAAIPGINLKVNTDTVITVNISPTLSLAQGNDDYFLFAELSEEEVYNRSQHIIQYNHLPTLQYFSTPFAKVLRPNWKTTAKHIGYIEGAGDFIPSFLRLAGLQVDILKEGDLTHAENLKKYDAIITGIRAVNVEKRMSYWLPVLFEYVQNGGTLVMQYNTLQDLATNNIGPYPITLSSQRVTEENAKVTFVEQKHKLLNYPNKITDADFADWVQERGLYFPSKCDEKYTPLFLMNDTGEQPQSNCTLYTKYGKGNYIYTTLSFSRQLPAGNKGAIRLLMNMISIGK